MAEPMDLSDADFLQHAEALAVASRRWSAEGLRNEIYDAMRAIRDAATTAEWERCIAIVERQPYYPDTHTGMRQQWVKDQILAALARRRP